MIKQRHFSRDLALGRDSEIGAYLLFSTGLSRNYSRCRQTGSYPETGFETITPTKDHAERRGQEAASMAHRKTTKRSRARSMLRLADLEQSKNAVLHSLGAASSQES